MEIIYFRRDFILKKIRCKTSGLLSKTSGLLSKTSGLLSKTSGLLSKTSGLLSKTSGLLRRLSILKTAKFIIIFFYFIIAGCQADPSPKKYPVIVQKKTINKPVTNSYNPSVDILFIIDNSASMGGVQKLLSKNAQLFINEFLETEFIDYHIAVTNSSAGLAEGEYGEVPVQQLMKKYGFDHYVSDGELAICRKLAEKSGYNYPNYVDRNTPRAGECLKEMMKVGTNSPTGEFFFNIPILTLSKEGFKKNSSFYRPDAHLAVFIITDSFNQSHMTSEDFYQFLLDLKGGDEKKIHYAAGVVTFAVRQYTCYEEDNKYPTSFIKAAKLFGKQGYVFNLCRFDFGRELAYFANHLVDSALVIPLDHMPVMDSIEVYYNYKGDSQLVSNGPEGWSYNAKNNVIHLSRDIRLKKGGDGKFDVKYKMFYTPEL